MLALAPIRNLVLDPLGLGETDMANPRLETRILAVFEQAVADGEWDAANHLLCALEALSCDAMPGSSVAAAYCNIAQEAALPQQRQRCRSGRQVRTSEPHPRGSTRLQSQ
ncbi:MAG TPA: hypothetical protein VD978_30020 [Azospirillum sp.]|nr:hypothetical protein [Azospirillum sp.]